MHIHFTYEECQITISNSQKAIEKQNFFLDKFLMFFHVRNNARIPLQMWMQQKAWRPETRPGKTQAVMYILIMSYIPPFTVSHFCQTRIIAATRNAMIKMKFPRFFCSVSCTWWENTKFNGSNLVEFVPKLLSSSSLELYDYKFLCLGGQILFKVVHGSG